MPITAGSFTVGTGGGQDYATWELATDDIGLVLTGNLILTQTSDVTETGQINRSDIDLAGFDLTFDSDTPHAGIVGAGHIINMVATASILYVDSSSSGTFEVKDLQFKHTAGSGLQCISMGVANGATGITCLFHDMIYDGNGVANPWEFYVKGGFNNFCDTWNILHTDADTAQTGFGNIRIDTNSGNGDRTWNCIIENAGTGIGFALADMSNIAGTQSLDNLITNMPNSIISFEYFGFEAAQIPERFMHNCASIDNSGDGGTDYITGYTPATEFESLVKGNALFMVPKPTSQFAKAGAAIWSTEDMKGLAFYDGVPPIGGFRASSAPVAPSNGSVRGRPILRLTRRQARLMRFRNPRMLGDS